MVVVTLCALPASERLGPAHNHRHITRGAEEAEGNGVGGTEEAEGNGVGGTGEAEGNRGEHRGGEGRVGGREAEASRGEGSRGEHSRYILTCFDADQSVCKGLAGGCSPLSRSHLTCPGAGWIGFSH